MVEQPDLEAGIGNDELDPIVLASFCGLAVVVKVVNIDYRPDFFIAICGDIPFILFLQLACKIRELFRTFVLLLVVDDNVIYGLELLEILSFGNSSASYDKITLLACPVETCRLATMRGNASLLRHRSSSPFMICANTVWKLGFGVAPYTPLR